MAIRTIRTMGDDVLRKKCKEVTEITKREITLINDMIDTMFEANGVGLAAPQVGILKRIFVIDIDDENGTMVFINPEILETNGTQCGEEGCLSVPGIYKKVRRPEKIKIEYTNIDGENITEEVDDFLAIIMQHEYDHLDGILFVDKVSPIAKRMISRKLQAMKKETKKAEEVED